MSSPIDQSLVAVINFGTQIAEALDTFLEDFEPSFEVIAMITETVGDGLEIIGTAVDNYCPFE
jgi:hypothetical protein